VITFDEAVDVESGNVTIFLGGDDSTVEAIDVTSGQVTGTGTTEITINPTDDLLESTAYYVQIDATAFDDSSENSFAGISDTTTWNFTTADESNPTASSYSPTAGATSVAVDSNFVVTFNEAVDVESGNITLFTSSGATVEAIDVTSDQVSGTGTDTITINPSADLVKGTSYYVQIDATAFDDTTGNSYAGIADTATWSFTAVEEETGGDPEPVIAAPEPLPDPVTS